MSRVELQMLYKAETAQCSEAIDCFARIGRMGDIIIDGDGVEDYIREKIKETCSLEIPDPDYVEWLEDKLMELLSDSDA